MVEIKENKIPIIFVINKCPEEVFNYEEEKRFGR